MLIKKDIKTYDKGKEEKKSKSTPKWRKNNDFITINTNKKLVPTSKDYEDLKKKFKNVLNKMYEDIADNGLFVEFKDGVGEWSDKYIKEVSIDSAIETGPKNNALHCHFMLSIKHKANIKLDYVDMRKKIKEDMGFKTDIHLDSKLFRDNSVNLIEYIKKTREDSKKKKEDDEE